LVVFSSNFEFLDMSFVDNYFHFSFCGNVIFFLNFRTFEEEWILFCMKYFAHVYGLYKICNFMVDVFVSARFLC
jgi:hypothetical protein